MKKVLFILLLMVSLGILMAVESLPSETVGYFKKTVASNSWEAFSYPFYQTDMSVATLIGAQGELDDMIIDANSGLLTQYYGGEFGWFGDVSDFVPGAAYWYVRAEANPDLDYFLMGTVNPQAVTVNIIGGGWTPFALNEAQNIAIAILPLAGVSLDDMIIDAKTGLLTQYYGGEFGWFGDITDIEPTHVYWYVSVGSDFSWTYTPAARAAVSPFRTSK
jgi:hypothetical protein